MEQYTSNLIIFLLAICDIVSKVKNETFPVSIGGLWMSCLKCSWTVDFFAGHFSLDSPKDVTLCMFLSASSQHLAPLC